MLRGVRALLLAVLVGCGGAAVPAAPSPVKPVASEPDRPLVDPIAALAIENAELSWAVPGPMRLELGGSALPAGGSGRPVEVVQIDQQGSLVRVAMQLEIARFSLWIERANLLAVIKREVVLARLGPPVATETGGDIEVALRPGARVRRLGHRGHRTQVRYLGAVEVEGWVPDDALGDRARPRDGVGRVPTGRRTKMVISGAVIRSEPRWASAALATVNNGYFLDAIKDLDEAWTEVGYEDEDVRVHGYVSTRDPPGPVHRWHETDATAVVVPTTTAASGTCLYARAKGEAIGYLVGNRPVALDDGGDGWPTLTIDTPWGPLPFTARGRAGELATCGPPP